MYFDENDKMLFTEFDSDFLSDFKIEKLYDSKNSPYNSNFIIKIKSGKIFPHVVYLRLNKFQLFRLKWNSKKYLLQSEEMKKDILKYFIGGIIGFLFGIFSQYINNAKTSTVNTPQTENQNSLEHK